MVRRVAATESQRLLIEACLDKGITFLWDGPGLLLIDRAGVDAVVEVVIAAGATVLGFEGFEVPVEIHPRLDLIFDAEVRPDIRDPLSAISEWPADVWVDVALKV